MVHFMRRKLPWLLFVAAGLGAIVLAVLILLLISAGSEPGGPSVAITEIQPSDPVLAKEMVVVRGLARDPGGVDRAELWVNGERVAVQHTLTSEPTMGIQQAWLPEAPGMFTVVLRAVNTEGRQGQSEPRLLRVEERSYGSTNDAPLQIVLPEDTTPEELAEATGLDPAIIPTGEGDGGDSVRIPDPGEPWEEDPGTAEDPPEDMPSVEPAEAPAAVPFDEEPVGTPFWWNLPGTDLICSALPSACGGGSAEAKIVPEKPGAVQVNVGADGCRVEVTWHDRSTNEDGFNVWRQEIGSGAGREHLTRKEAAPGTGSLLAYSMEHAGRGRFIYLVDAYNESGNVTVPAPRVIETRCAGGYTGPGVPVVVEADSMQVVPEVDQLYCYASVAGAPFERVPASDDEFIEVESGRWNIADYLSGENSRRLWVDRERDLHVHARCFGRNSGTVVPLGEFSAGIPPDRWDGRLLTFGPDGGAYHVGLRVYFSGRESGGERARLVDPDIPAPTHLSQVMDWLSCMPWMRRVSQCGHVEGLGVSWDYPVLRFGSPLPEAYRVFRRAPDASAPEQAFVAWHPAQSAPLILASEGCAEHAYYSVNAISSQRDPVTGQRLESPPSGELEVSDDCVQIEITLEQLHQYEVSDGSCSVFKCDTTAEGYGRLWIGDREIVWNAHCDSDGCLGGGSIPGSTKVPEGTTFDWADLYLNSGDGWAQGNNQFTIVIPPDEGFGVSWVFKDHDKVSGDDKFCRRRTTRHVFPARSASEWRRLDQSTEVEGDKCFIRLRMRGVRTE